MTQRATIERKNPLMKRAVDTDEDIVQILERLNKLSKRPDNPGQAYQNLETINALVNTLRGKLDISTEIV
jgi:hypothetical protein